ncbi:unnamed protein product [Symbiodinium pilosum]|uniref:Uncharacterized protein n=1 Tax=Symbiodinium pilosum TaxID=2952 RepID=A0A812NXK5_SYMPI|nr:unnamed protein product [Symbiodinium pilosum]
MGIFRSLECHGSFQGPAECKDAGDHWPKLGPGMRGITQATQATEASWIGDTFCLQPPLFPRRHQLHQLASFLKVPTSFEDEDDAASKVADDEVPRPPDSPLNNLAKFRTKHARTQDGYLCAAAGVKDEQAFTGCTDLPAPDGTNIGRFALRSGATSSLLKWKRRAKSGVGAVHGRAGQT